MRARRFRGALCLLALVCALPLGGATAAASCAPASHSGGDWPMMGYDLGQSRHQPNERIITPSLASTLAPAWTFNANAAAGKPNQEVTGYPVVFGGCLYVGSSSGNGAPGWVFALNADSGALVWKRQVSNGVYSTLAVDDERVYAFVSRVGSPYVVALDRATGAPLWETTVDEQPGSDAVSSPIVYAGHVWVGISGTAAEGDEGERFEFQGNFVLLDAETGELVRKTYTIPALHRSFGFAGGAIWSTVAVDETTGLGYVGTGNPFNYEDEHFHTNAVLKIDMRPSSPTFGAILGYYKGDVEEYQPGLWNNIPCDEDDPVGVFLAGFECGRLDLDFGAAPNVFTDASGRRLVGAGQKSGVYHVFDASTMRRVWKAIVGVPSPVGGIVGTPAYDGRAIHGPHTLAGYLWSVNKDNGALRWVAPVGDAVHWGNPVTSANGVVYTVDLKGFLDAYDAETGAPLLHRPLSLQSGTRTDAPLTWGGVSVARNTVYTTVGVGLTSVGAWPPWPRMTNGFVIAFRPAPPSLP